MAKNERENRQNKAPMQCVDEKRDLLKEKSDSIGKRKGVRKTESCRLAAL